MLRACIVNYWVTVYLTPPHSCLYDLRHLPRMSLLAPDNQFKGERRLSRSYLPQTKSKPRQRRTERAQPTGVFPGISPLTACQTRKRLLLSSGGDKVKGALENTWRWENSVQSRNTAANTSQSTLLHTFLTVTCHRANLDSQTGTVTGDGSCDILQRKPGPRVCWVCVWGGSSCTVYISLLLIMVPLCIFKT